MTDDCPMTDEHQPRALQCPACRAGRNETDTCRRCGADLALLREITRAGDRQRDACLTALREGRPTQALRHARDLHHLRPDADAQRLLRLCQIARVWASTFAGHQTPGTCE